MKKILLIISVCLILPALAVLFFFYNIQQYGNESADQNNSKIIIIINPGQSVSITSEKLYNLGIIKNPEKFKLLSRINGLDKKLKAGEYELSSSMTPISILDRLITGKVLLRRLTVPEGYNLYQIAALIEKSGLCSKEEFLQSATNPLLTRKMNLNTDTFEGYLFPDTYYFPKEIPPEKIITTMLKRFRSVLSPEWVNQAEKSGLSLHQIITLASIIEKETGASFERPIISSVFHNRLKKRMRLESDPTVIYGITNFNGNITRKDLRTRTPYNTYKIRGLPPGPIANPGLEALEAALYPAKTSFLYFVSKRDTTHKFSTNISDHNRAVRKYQILKR